MKIKFEAKTDIKTGLIYLEAFFPEDAVKPFAATGAIYKSHAEAEADMQNIVKEALQNI